jgi:hypothetical protein
MKPGIKSTEFWVAMGVILLAVAAAVLQQIPAEWAATAASIVGAIYVIARTALKLSGQGAIVDEAEAVRQTVREEVSFALAEKRKAEKASVNWPVLWAISLIALTWWGITCAILWFCGK